MTDPWETQNGRKCSLNLCEGNQCLNIPTRSRNNRRFVQLSRTSQCSCIDSQHNCCTYREYRRSPFVIVGTSPPLMHLCIGIPWTLLSSPTLTRFRRLVLRCRLSSRFIFLTLYFPSKHSLLNNKYVCKHHSYPTLTRRHKTKFTY